MVVVWSVFLISSIFLISSAVRRGVVVDFPSRCKGGSERLEKYILQKIFFVGRFLVFANQ